MKRSIFIIAIVAIVLMALGGWYYYFGGKAIVDPIIEPIIDPIINPIDGYDEGYITYATTQTSNGNCFITIFVAEYDGANAPPIVYKLNCADSSSTLTKVLTYTHIPKPHVRINYILDNDIKVYKGIVEI